MPGNRKITKKAIKGKDGIHPGSRKAGQLARVSLRTSKLQGAAKSRKDAFSAKLYRPTFFMHALTSPYPLTLTSLKALVVIFIERNDLRIAELEADRRPGRPKAKELLELEDRKAAESKEYETGFEVPDLTHPHTTRLLHSYLESDIFLDTSRIDLLRQIRVFRDNDDVVLSKPGRTDKMGFGDAEAVISGQGEDYSDTPGAGAAAGARGHSGGKGMDVES